MRRAEKKVAAWSFKLEMESEVRALQAEQCVRDNEKLATQKMLLQTAVGRAHERAISQLVYTTTQTSSRIAFRLHGRM